MDVRDKEECPVLLLNYTYFLNIEKTAFVSIGFDVKDFECKVVLYKNKKHYSFRISDWNHLSTNSHLIDMFFNSSKQIVIENRYGAVEIKLREKNGHKEVVFGLKKISLKFEYWKIFFHLFHHFNNIML